MFIYNDLAIKLALSILSLPSTGNDNKSINAEHGLNSSFTANNNIVSDFNQERNDDSRSEYFKPVLPNFKEEKQFVGTL